MKLLLPAEYVRRATQDVEKAQRRVLLLAMVIADHPATHDLIAAIEAAARRGVDVTVAADVFTYGEVSGSFLPVRYYSKNARLATKMAKTLKAAGVKFHWLGHGRLTLMNGRTHSKWCIADDAVYTFGGVNMYEGGIQSADYMLRTVDAALADRLATEQAKLQRAERDATNYANSAFPVGNDVALIDGGIVAHSMIYRRACELATDATHVLFVSQYCPTGKLGKLIKKKQSRVYFNRPEQATSFSRLLIRLSMLRTGIKTSYMRDRYLHAKFIIFTMPGGEQVALTGSHNFAYTGVLLGTREIALETSDKKIIKQLKEFFETQIA